MSHWAKFWGHALDGVAQSVAIKQSMQPSSKSRRKAKKKGGCTPCEAMAKVDATRQRLGYSIK